MQRCNAESSKHRKLGGGRAGRRGLWRRVTHPHDTCLYTDVGSRQSAGADSLFDLTVQIRCYCFIHAAPTFRFPIGQKWALSSYLLSYIATWIRGFCPLVQGIGVVKPGVVVENSTPGGIEKKPRPQKEQALNCPRCSSTNTKFCYYNNYSLSQPRYFCKTCRRYWTEGGSLRNVPVGGGSRKNKRSSSSSSSSAANTSISSANSSKKVFPDLSPPNFSPQNPKIHEGQDLNLAYNPSHYNGISEFVTLPFGLDTKNLNPQNPSSNTSHHHHIPVMELLKTGNISSGALSSFMSIPVSDSNSVYNSSGFPVNDQFKTSLGFSVDGLENGYGNIQGVEDHTNSSSRILFPFEELKPVSTHEFEQDRGQGETNAYWNGMLAGGSW